MDLNTTNVRHVVRRYRKPIIVAIVGLAATMMLVVSVAGYALYKTASFATDKIKTWEPGVSETASKLPAEAAGFVEGFVLNVASGWLQQQAATEDVAQMKNGLSCFDAIGGPSPTEIVGYVQRTVNDKALGAHLDDLSKSLRNTSSTVNGPAACANWFLNG